LAAQDSAFSPLPIGVTIAADVVSSYVFRGVDISDAPAIQPWATLSFGSTGLSATAWSSFAIVDRDELVPYSSSLTGEGVDEVDLTAAYGRTVGPITFGLGYIAYIYPSDQQDYVSQEVYGTLALSSVPFAPTVAAYYDFDETDNAADDPDTIEGAYVSLGVARSLPLAQPIDFAASVGWTNQEALRPDPGINDLNLSLGVPVAFGDAGVTFTPAVGVTRILADSSPYGDDAEDTFWAKVQLRLIR
jgi:hypothetical protein